MRRIPISDIPEDYHYYRSHLSLFSLFEIRRFSSSGTLVEEKAGHGYIIHYFWGLFSLAFFEKSDISPTQELLRKYGMRRGIIFWSPFHIDAPTGKKWISLGYLFARKFQHSTRSSFSILDTPEYWKKWSSNARGHRNKILKEVNAGNIKININASWEEFREVYKKVRVPHAFRRYFIQRQEFFMKNSPMNFRIILAYKEDIPLAGAIFFDDHPTSTYLIAFQNPEGKKSHLGLAIIDAWFSDSFDKGFKYLDFDHMKDILDSPSYAGYTKFKSEIADYDIRFPKMWMKIFF